MSHASMEFTLPVLTITGRAIMATALSTLPVKITTITLSLESQCYHLDAAISVLVNPLHLTHPAEQQCLHPKVLHKERVTSELSDVLVPHPLPRFASYRISDCPVFWAFPLWDSRFYTGYPP